MEILWLIIGFIIGLLVAWFYLDARYKKQSAEREAELLKGRQEAEEALERERDAHNTAKQRVAELENQHAKAREERASASAKLQASQEKLAQIEAASGKSNSEIAALQERAGQRDAEIKRLESDLAECRAKAASTASAPASGASAGTAPAFAASPPASSAPATGAAGGTTPAYAASPPPASGGADDLTKIKGIGQVLKGKLNRLGITTFRQIAEFTGADIERVNAELDFPGRIERERWVEQARDFVRR
jgi:predicted flap endonuclease-1-like 5' DNA nuclease